MISFSVIGLYLCTYRFWLCLLYFYEDVKVVNQFETEKYERMNVEIYGNICAELKWNNTSNILKCQYYFILQIGMRMVATHHWNVKVTSVDDVISRSDVKFFKRI